MSYYSHKIQQSQINRIEYTTLTFKNRLLIIKQIINNSEKLINDLVDVYDRLAKEYKREYDIRRQKIISKLNYSGPEFTLKSKSKEDNAET